jgi:hypothetical protein
MRRHSEMCESAKAPTVRVRPEAATMVLLQSILARVPNCTCAVVIGILSPSIALCDDVVDLELRAFIPSDAPNALTVNVNGRPQTAIKSPFELTMCYLTDQRAFSSELNKSSRIASSARVMLSSSPSLQSVKHAPGPTHAVKCDTGASYCTDTATMTDTIFGPMSVSGDTIEIPVAAAGANPCIWPAAPSIKYNGKFKVELGSGRVSFVGDVSSYPAIEAVAGYNGIYKPIFQEKPVGSALTHIIISRSINKSTTLPLSDGLWKSNDAGARFSVKISGSSFELTERKSSGQPLLTSGSLNWVGGIAIIERDNTTAVLSFLDFSPSVIAEINARNPRPSKLTLKRTIDGIDASWAGLLVTKDAHGKFESMKQPGEGPIKNYQLRR